ncbi:MAG: glutathione S-transferase family protein [Gammaproteobacteria bacterium]|jgi:glutathione S-transferase|nr:glutathione S-transferase family protein [Gammaproteobacteria bacterium]
MSGFILHQYAGSPFSEKIRLLMGYLDLPSQQVEIPVIMPRPQLMPLTGGYRRTPVLQRGREVYCDTALIAKILIAQGGGQALLPQAQRAVIETVSYWADTFLFRVVVAVAFQPKALAGNPLFESDAEAAAFMADRAEFSKGSTGLQMDLDVALSHFDLWLRQMNSQLGAQAFLFGQSPTLADFSVYHCLWFIAERPVLFADLAAFPEVMRWFADMAAFGHGRIQSMGAEEALQLATSEPFLAKQKVLTSKVSVCPIDYGLQPVTGALVEAEHVPDAYSVLRDEPGVGEVLVHFPRLGFRCVPL